MSCSTSCLNFCSSNDDILFIRQRATLNFSLYSSIFQHVILIKAYTALLTFLDEIYSINTQMTLLKELDNIYTQYDLYYKDFITLKDIDFGTSSNGCGTTKKIPASDFFGKSIPPLSSSKLDKSPSLQEIYDEVSITLPRLKKVIDELIYEKSKNPEYIDIDTTKIFNGIERIELLAAKYKNYFVSQ